MKKIVLSLVLVVLAGAGAFAQELPINASTGKVTWLEVVDSKNMKAADLYKVLTEWCVAQGYTYQKKDEANGEAVFNGNIPMEYSSLKPGKNDKGKVNFTFSIFAKDDKYRYIVTDFVHEGLEGAGSGGKLENQMPDCGKSGMVSGNWVLIKNKTKGQMVYQLKEMKKAVVQVQNDPAKNKDW